MIAIVSSHAQLGGAERYIEMLLDALGPTFDASIIALEDGPFAERHDAQVIETGPGAYAILRSALRLRRSLRASPPDVVHANGVKAGLVSGLATWRTDIPTVWVKHDFSFDGRLVDFVARRARIIVAVSAALVESLPAEIRSRKVRVVHTGLPELPRVDRAEARQLLTASLGAPTPQLIVGLVGRLHPVKGHGELIAIAPALAEELPGLRIVFIGGPDPALPEFAAELEEAVAAVGLGDVITFLGHRDDVQELIGGLDVAVIASVRLSGTSGREGFPLVGLELLSAEVPVVAYADGGVPELLGDCGLLVEPGDREALRAALAGLLASAAARTDLGRRGRARVAEQFTVEQWADAMRAVYAEASSSPPGER